MKIILLGTVAASALNFRTDLIKSLVANGHQVFVFCVDFTDETRQRIRDLGAIPMDYSLNRAGMNPLRDLRDTWSLSRQLKTIQPDVVFAYFVKPVIFGTLAAALAGVKRRIGMLEGLGYVFTDLPSGVSTKQKILRKIQVLLYRMAFPFLERLIFLNPDDPVDLLEKNNLKVKQVSVLGGIGLDLIDYSYVPLPANKPVSFIFVGRLLAEKGINEYIAAAKLVKAKHSDIRFVVLGGLDEENPGGLSATELKQLTDSRVVEHPGHVSNVKDWLAEASVFVLPSYREGVPRSTQEAMAIGRAVIATDVPGCRETVEHGVNGFVVPKWDEQALAEAMIKFIEQPELIEKMGLESYRIAQEKFDVVKVNDRLMNMIEASK